MRALRKFLCLPRADRRLLVGAALLLGLIGAALRLVSFKKLLHLSEAFCRRSSQGQNLPPPSSECIIWAITAANRRMPFGRSCLTQALATKILLTYWGHPARMRIGVSKGEHGRLEAHAWVESRGVVVMGAQASSRFVPLPSMDRGNI
jgi:hypothetical protein